MLTTSRLILARQRRGLTKVKLAEMAGLDVQTLSRYEAGAQLPTAGSLQQLATALGFSAEFLSAQEVETIDPGDVSFRALKSMTAKKRDGALASGSLAMEFNNWVERRFDLVSVNLPPEKDFATPELAAEATRSHWGLGALSIGNMVHQLEKHGVRVFSLAENCAEVNAFSLWRDGKPFVFLNTMKTPERSRFDAAHELGHLVLHQGTYERNRDIEREANTFAAAFLMPRSSVLACAPRHPSLPSLISAKRNWDVSLSALVQRLREVDMLSEWHHRKLFEEIGAQGYRTKEPNGLLHRETSQVWTKVFAALRKEGVVKSDIARELGLPIRELDAFVFGLVEMGTIEGGGETSYPAKTHLRSV
jgi:Zn-dependent peptidase ImmA (M78 family)/transcriptional regulator with XRE-family HTH domain